MQHIRELFLILNTLCITVLKWVSERERERDNEKYKQTNIYFVWGLFFKWLLVERKNQQKLLPIIIIITVQK